MAKFIFRQNGTWDTGIKQLFRTDFRTLVYDGTLGGGTLQLLVEIDGVVAPIPDSKLNATMVDGNGDVIRSFPFRSAGAVKVVLAGAEAPNVTVAVL